MRVTKVLGIVLLVLGLLAVIFGGFSYTRDRQTAEIGPIEIEGVVLIVAGGALLLVPAGR